MRKRSRKEPDWDTIRDQRLEVLGSHLMALGRLDAIPTDMSFVVTSIQTSVEPFMPNT